MGKSKKDWAYYLEAYGSDLSRWPADVLENADLEALKNSDAFTEEAELDSMLASMAWPEPDSQLKKNTLRKIHDTEPRVPWTFGLEPSDMRQSLYIAVIFALSLFIGFSIGGKTYINSNQNYEALASAVWYVGPAYVLTGTLSEDRNGHS